MVRRWYPALAGATLLGSLWWGYRAGVSSTHPAEISASPATHFTERPALRNPAPTDSDEDFLLGLLKKRLLTPEEKRQCWKAVRSLSISQVQAMLDAMETDSQGRVRSREASMLFFRWGQLDPEGALAVAAANPKFHNIDPERSILAAWLSSDFDAVMRWAATDAPRGRGTACLLAGRMLAFSDPENAITRAAAAHKGVVYGALYAGLSRQLAGTAEDRAKFISFAAQSSGEDMWQSVMSEMIRNCPDGDLAGFLKEPAVLALTEEQKGIVQRLVIPHLAVLDPGKALDIARESGGPEGKWRESKTFKDWIDAQPAEAATWAERNHAPEIVSTLVKDSTTKALYDPGIALEKLTPAYQAWEKLEPDVAASWLESLPPSLSKRLSPDHQDETR